jgi:hypothetical protein
MRPIDWARRAERIWQLPIPPLEPVPSADRTPAAGRDPTPTDPTQADPAPEQADLFSPIAMR